MIAYAQKENDLILLGKQDYFDYDTLCYDKGYSAIWELQEGFPTSAIIELIIHAGLKGVDYWRLESMLDGYEIQKAEYIAYLQKTLGVIINESNTQFIATISRPDKRWVAQGYGLVKTTIQVLRKFQTETREDFKSGLLG